MQILWGDFFCYSGIRFEITRGSNVTRNSVSKFLPYCFSFSLLFFKESEWVRDNIQTRFPKSKTAMGRSLIIILQIRMKDEQAI